MKQPSGVEGFGVRLGEARRAKGLRDGKDYRPADLARDMDTSSPTISRWENGENIPDVLTIAKLAKVLGVEPGWLAFGTANPGASPNREPRPPLAETESLAPRASPRPTRRQKGA